jgi:predicted amidophosphoribosyltransferase
MIAISPRKIYGPYQDGYVLDFHTVRSMFVGYESYGHEAFSTERSPIGELLYRLKNRRDLSVVDELVETAAGFVKRSVISVSGVVPVPPSNTARKVQPVEILGKGIAALLRVEWLPNAVLKLKRTSQLKDVFDLRERRKILAGAFSANGERVSGKSVLLFDDLYRSGATMDAVAAVLQKEGKASAVHALAITRTRVKR